MDKKSVWERLVESNVKLLKGNIVTLVSLFGWRWGLSYMKQLIMILTKW